MLALVEKRVPKMATNKYTGTQTEKTYRKHSMVH